ALVALFLPRAQVELEPVRQAQRIVIPVVASPSTDSVFITGSIPAHELRIIVEGEQSISVTGSGSVARSKAQGVAVFRNLTQDEVPIPAGTVVRSGEVRFVTTVDGTLDAGVGETIELAIEALEGGVAGNLDAESIDTVDGRLGLSVSVSNPGPTEGGFERASVQATESDRARAKELLLERLERDARASLADELDSDDIFFNQTLELAQIISEVYDLPSGAAGPQLTLSMQAEFSVLYASASDLNELASLALNASLPSGFSPTADGLMYEPVTDPLLLEEGSLRWEMRVEREIAQQINPVFVTQLVQGLGASAAQSRLEENLPLLSKPSISLNPSWWPWVPIVPFRIEVVMQ
ncbi:MAG: baseplate J/gp47 family protein, partial [Anaerolineales bacterium]|nr:baseplate J/gp47 family protein [Anaerolineales bacterium]